MDPAPVQGIWEQLYQEYFENARTPGREVSSHWSLMHRGVSVVMDAKGRHFKRLKGHGFGDMQMRSPLNRFFADLTIRSYRAQVPAHPRAAFFMNQGRSLARDMGFYFSYDCFRQVCSLLLIDRYLTNRDRLRVVVIGDGFGYLSGLIKKIYPGAAIMLIDLGKRGRWSASGNEDRRLACTGALITFPGAASSPSLRCQEGLP